MRKKAAISLPVTFLVTLIISLVIFGGSMAFIKTFYAKTTQLSDQVDKNTEAQINALLLGNEKVAIVPTSKQVQIGKSVDFGIGISNEDTSGDQFYVKISFAGSVYDDMGTKLPSAPSMTIVNAWPLYSGKDSPIKIVPGDRKVIPVRVTVKGSGVVKGRYPFNVCIIKDTIKPTSDCGKGNYQDNKLYPVGKIHRIDVIVR